MKDLKNTSIGGKSITLKRVPARDARHIQTMLIAAVIEPLSDVLSGESAKELKMESKGEQVLFVLKGAAAILPKLNDGELDNLIDKCKPFIMVDGKQFDENGQFDSDTLFDMYEVLAYFLQETFSSFISAIRSRFPQTETMMALKK